MIRAPHTSPRLAGSFACAILLFLFAPRALAHDGPPYPIFVDENIADWTVSVWADPDVGTGTFYYYLTAPRGHKTDEVIVRAISSPEDGKSPEVAGESEAAKPTEPFQQIGKLQFHHRGYWTTRLVFERTGEEGAPLGELTYRLNVTPPGLGKVNLLWFSFPFILIGGLWLRTLLAQRAHERAATVPTSPETTPR